jgi:phage shock protein E
MLDFLKQILGGSPSIDLAELKSRGAVVLDVRSPQEFKSGHAKGAVNIPVDVLAAKLSGLDKNKPVITCCASGMRSASAASILKANGFTEVINGGPWQNVQ